MIGVTLVVMLIFFTLNKALIYNELNSLNLIPQPEKLTELYFNDNANLPNSVKENQVINFAFVIHNLETADYQYDYVVSVNANGKRHIVDSGNVWIKDNKYFVKNEQFMLLNSQSRQEVVVELTNKQQSIDFWINMFSLNEKSTNSSLVGSEEKNTVKKITIVIPALNEEKGIGLVLKEIPVNSSYRHGLLKLKSWSLIMDQKIRLAHIAKQHGATVIIQPIRGYGNAYKAGFANASGDIIATGDADLLIHLKIYPQLSKKWKKKNLDFISTNRLMYVSPEVMTPSHIFGNKLLTTMTKLLFNSPFVDSQSGMWIFRREIWDELNVKIIWNAIFSGTKD